MKPLVKTLALFVLIVGIFAYTSKEETTENLALDLNLETVNVLDVLSEQSLSCRPSADFSFFVETNVKERLRGATSIEAKVYVTEKESGKTALVSNETVLVPSFEGSLLVEEGDINITLQNGDNIIASESEVSLKELMQFETIRNSYIKSTNKLLDMQRSI